MFVTIGVYHKLLSHLTIDYCRFHMKISFTLRIAGAITCPTAFVQFNWEWLCCVQHVAAQDTWGAHFHLHGVSEYVLNVNYILILHVQEEGDIAPFWWFNVWKHTRLWYPFKWIRSFDIYVIVGVTYDYILKKSF